MMTYANGQEWKSTLNHNSKWKMRSAWFARTDETPNGSLDGVWYRVLMRIHAESLGIYIYLNCEYSGGRCTDDGRWWWCLMINIWTTWSICLMGRTTRRYGVTRSLFCMAISMFKSKCVCLFGWCCPGLVEHYRYLGANANVNLIFNHHKCFWITNCIYVCKKTRSIICII